MAFTKWFLLGSSVALLSSNPASAGPLNASSTGSLKDINHVVLFMQENRAFDHYFGTMAGIRGFSDPNVQVNANNRSVWYQDVNSTLSNVTDYLLPWHLNYQGGNWTAATQCMIAGDNGWNDNHAALNGDLNNKWALNNTPWSWGYFERADLPVHFAIAEGWTVGDMYQESVIASTDPNRISWVSGSINAPGSPQSLDEGGMMIDNNETPGCEGEHLNCYPPKWKTTPEIYQAAGVSWQVYQDLDNFDDNPLAWFAQYQTSLPGTPLSDRGVSFEHSLDNFYADAMAGTLPQISYIIGPMELSEHPPYMPKDGAWLQKKVVDAVTKGKSYNDTVLIISYDETGGFGDHVTPYHSPAGTAGEWVADPYGAFGDVYTGPGFRLPFYMVSPWTRGGNVFVEHADHVSQIKFVEQWLGAKGYNVTSDQIPSWRREHMSDLVKAFDFANPDYSLPDIPEAETPHQTLGVYDGTAICEATYSIQRPPVPYGNQTAATSLVSETGFKVVRGQLTEGRNLVFENHGYGIANLLTDVVTGTKASATHQDPTQKWVVLQVSAGSDRFRVSSAMDRRFLGRDLKMGGEDQAEVFTFADMGNGKGYSIMDESGSYLSMTGNGTLGLSSKQAGWKTFSVT